MIRNYLKIAWRNILKHKFHSLLNIIGLSIGIAFTLLIAAYVWGELNVNNNLKNVKNQYIVQSNWKDPNMGLNLTTVGPLVKALREQYPGLVANYYRWDGITSNVSKGDKVFREGLQIGDSTMLNMFGFKLSYGDTRTALNEPFSVVITEDRAIKYFGKKDVVGETLTIESFSGSKHDFKITGVMAMPGVNSVTRMNADNDNQVFIPVSSINYFGRNVDLWNNPYIVGYVELQKGVKPQDLQKPMQQILAQNSNSNIAGNMQPYLAPLTDYYLKQNNNLVKKMLYTVSFIALFILIMAIINFINISVGKSSTRIKEIGVRKVMGGLKRQLMYQFLTESIVLVFFAMIFAFGMYVLANPFLSGILGKNIPLLFSFPAYYILAPLVLIFVIGILAGIYPAFILSGLKAVDSVKGKFQSVNGNVFFRKTLVGFQFCAASVVLIGTLIATKQVALFFGNDLGYNKEFVVSVQLPRNWTDEGIRHMQVVRDEFSKLPEVSEASVSWSIPNGMGAGTTLLYPEGKDSTQAVAHETIVTDEKYLDVFKIPLIAGRYFQQPSDSFNLVINESAARSLGWKNANDAIGKRLFAPGNFPLTIIGVTKDFHFGSMKGQIAPLMITDINLNKVYRLLCFKLKPGNVGNTMAAIQKKWSTLLPGTAFDYKFMDESLQILYQSEIQLKKASQVATALALIIVVLGIIGLISLSIQKRTKEIGIRKVLGASIPNIAALFMKDFIPVILIGGIISIPIAWYMMQNWLNDYSYRVAITAQPFAISIIVLGMITTLLIILQISRAALQNPVKSLRTE
ncbi:MAG: ABC transporter permease [Ferruginibacter sp.]